jgi:hypothetical protein
MAALAGRRADVYIVAGDQAGTAFTQEACTGDAARIKYQINNTAKRYWSTTTAITVETSPDGAVWTAQPTSEYQIGYAGGFVLFAVARASGTQVRVTGAYLSTAQLTECKDWALNVDIQTAEDTVFGDSWRTFPYVKRGGTVNLGRFWVDNYFVTNIGGPFLLVLYADQPANVRYELTGRMTAESLTAATAGLVEQGVTFVIDGPIHYAGS